jgi:hypothetical protein
MRRALGWTAGFLLVLIVGIWWVFNVYAPAPRAPRMKEQPPHRPFKRLNYEFADSSRDSYVAGVLNLRNGDKFAWTNLNVEIWVYALPGNRNLRFTCRSPSTVWPRGVLPVPFRDCTELLPSDVEYAVFSSVHVQAHEGGINSAFEPGFPIRSRAIRQR